MSNQDTPLDVNEEIEFTTLHDMGDNDDFRDLFGDGAFTDFYEAVESTNLQDVDNEDDFKKIKENSWRAHSDQYTALLSNYVSNLKDNLETKQKQKSCFFYISMFILFVTMITSIIIIYKISTSNIVTMYKVVEIIHAVLTFFTPLFVIPNLIAKYLFNTKDEEHMIEIVKQIINHDNNSMNK